MLVSPPSDEVGKSYTHPVGRSTLRAYYQLAHLYQIATRYLAAPATAQVMALIDKDPVAGGISAYL